MRKRKVSLEQKQAAMRERHAKPSQKHLAAAGKLWRAGQYLHKQGGKMSALFLLDDLHEHVMEEYKRARDAERGSRLCLFKSKAAGA